MSMDPTNRAAKENGDSICNSGSTDGLAPGAPTPGEDPFESARHRLELRRQARVAKTETKRLPADVTSLAVGQRPIDLYLAGRQARPETMAQYRRLVRATQGFLARSGFAYGDRDTALEEFPWQLVDPMTAVRFHALVHSHHGSPGSANNFVIVAREMLRLAHRCNLIDARQLDNLLRSLPVKAVGTKRVGREVTIEELERLLDAASTGPDAVLAARNVAIIATLAGTGFRRCEVVSADLDDVDLVRGCMTVTMKGGELRNAWLPDGTVKSLADWITVRGDEPGPLFLSKSGRRLHGNDLRLALDRVQARAGVAHFTPHDLRRTYVTMMLRQGVDPFVVMRAVGHQQVTTTLIYDRRTQAEDRAAVDLIHVPRPTKKHGKEEDK
jgi:integrase